MARRGRRLDLVLATFAAQYHHDVVKPSRPTDGYGADLLGAVEAA